jgi:amino acid transporter
VSAEPADAAGTVAAVDAGPPRTLGVRQAAFIGVGAMVGAGIFALLGSAGEVAGAAVWLSFLLAGAVAGLQGYSFAKFGSRYPSAGGLLEYVVRGFGDGHVTGVLAWLILAANAIVTGMVAVSFGSYASSSFADGSEAWVKVFAVLVVVAMTALNTVGSTAVARAQTVVVVVVIGILTVFSVATLANLDPDLLAFSGYPPFDDIIASVALTFFAFLGFGVVTFTAKDLADPARQLPRAMFLALGLATLVYVAVALGVFGTLTVDEVIDSGGTALAVAAEPVLGRAGYWMMTVTALFATSGATNAGLYPASGLCEQMAAIEQFPPSMGRRHIGDRLGTGLLVTAAVAIVLAVGFDLSAIASIGSVIALLVFGLVSVGHLRVRSETGAKAWVLVLAVASTAIVLLSFVFTTLVDEPGTAVALVLILLLSIVLDLAWKRSRDRRGGAMGAGAAPVRPHTRASS